jgi:hypothetical protein
MRRGTLIVGLGVLLGMFVPAAHGQLPSGDSVVGQGRTIPFGDMSLVETFDVEARSGPSGENPSGSVTLEIGFEGLPPFFHFEGPVRCLSVSGNDALVGFELHPPFGAFPGAVIEIEDNGPPGSDPPDFFWARPVADPSSCAPSDLTLPPVAEGDVRVIDVPSAPTSKAECEKGGYELFGFKNQGQCVAFVQRGPK